MEAADHPEHSSEGRRMSYGKAALLAATTWTAASIAAAQNPTFDPAQLPAVTGKVAQYTLTPRGGVDGLILDDGTEVQVSSRESLELVFAIRPGDVVTVHGLKARQVPMIQAMSITNDATHLTIVTQGGRGGRDRNDNMQDQGKIKAQLHDDDGDVDGVLLEDGTTVDLPDPEAARIASQLTPGQTIYVRGAGISNALGRNIAADVIGPDKQHASEIQGASEEGGRDHGRHGHGGHGHGDDSEDR